MAITPTDYARRVELTGTSYAFTITGQDLVITEANLPSEIWSLALNGGGDLRVCENSDGTNQLPLHVILFDTVAETAVLWTRLPTYSSAARTVWLFYDRAGDSQPAPSSTFGSQNVYQDFELFTHDGVTDATGNYTLTQNGSPGTGTSPLGSDSVTFNGSNQWVDATVSKNQDAFPYAVGGWIQTTTTASSGTMAGFATDSVADQYSISLYRAGQSNETIYRAASTASNQANALGTLAANTWGLFHSVWDASNDRSAWFNGGNKDTSSASRIAPYLMDSFDIGRIGDSSPGAYLSGQTAHTWWRDTTLTDNQVEVWNDNQSSPATFWTTGTPESTGGATPDVDIATTLPAPTFTLEAEATLPQPEVAVSTTLPAPQFALTAETIAPPAEVAITFTMPAPRFQVGEVQEIAVSRSIKSTIRRNIRRF